MNKNYTIVTTEETYAQLINHIKTTDYQAFDVEATGLNVRKDKVIGYGVCGTIGEAYYLPIYYWDTLSQTLELFPHGLDVTAPLRLLTDILTWNGTYDLRITKNDLKIDLMDSLAGEVMLMKHTIEEDGRMGLKATAIELQEQIGLDVERAANEEQIELKENIKKNGGSVTKVNYELYKADMPVIGKYCCADVDLTLRIAEYYFDKVEDEGLADFFFDDEVMPLYKEVTIPMEEHGVKLDMPFLLRTQEEIIVEMAKLEAEVVKQLKETDDYWNWLEQSAIEKYPSNNKGLFAQKFCENFNIDLPKSEKTGKYSLTKKNKEALPDSNEKEFLLGNFDLFNNNLLNLDNISIDLWIEKQGDININSKTQMGGIVFNHMGIKPLGKTKGGAPQFNEEFVVHLAEEHEIEWASTLRLYNKLLKIKSSYVDRLIDGQENGFFYFSYKQHGTISGRYGSDAQQMPRPKEEGEDHPIVLEFSNRIRKFMIAEEGRILVDCDYESLEPHVFAHVSTDEKLKDIFRKGHDFYSTIAIATEKLTGVSADKKADNYLGKINKILRQAAKAYCLGIPYGMEAYALGKALGISTKEAAKLIEGYLAGFPDLKRWMDESDKQAQLHGFVTSEAGRVRHLPKVKHLYKLHGTKLKDFKYRNKLLANLKRQGYSKDEAKKTVDGWKLDYKNGVNNAKNFQVQSLAGSIVNRAAIAITREFKKRGIDAWVCAQIHDQLIFNVPVEKAEECRLLVQELMENTTKLSIDLKAPAVLGENWYEAH